MAERADGVRRFRVVADDGSSVVEPRGGERVVYLSDGEGEQELIDFLGDLQGRLSPTTDVRVEVATLLARLERRQARRKARDRSAADGR